jgi:hypothetical protein
MWTFERSYRVNVVNVLKGLAEVLLEDKGIKEEGVARGRLLLGRGRRDVSAWCGRGNAASLALVEDLGGSVDGGAGGCESQGGRDGGDKKGLELHLEDKVLFQQKSTQLESNAENTGRRFILYARTVHLNPASLSP